MLLYQYHLKDNEIGNRFMIYCSSSSTLKYMGKLAFSIYSSCLHSMTKERPCEYERSQMNEA